MVHVSNPTGKGGFVFGEVGNPNGRTPGSRNKRTAKTLYLIDQTGNPDPLVVLSELSAKSPDEGIRAQAATALAPYLHGKLVPKSEPRYIETDIQLPVLDSLANAVQSIALIESALVAGNLSTEDAKELISVINAYIAGRNVQAVEELQARVDAIEQTHALNPPTHPAVEGGLPELPGTRIIFDRRPSEDSIPSRSDPFAPPPSGANGPDVPVVIDMPKPDTTLHEPPSRSGLSDASRSDASPGITFAHPAEWHADIWKCR